MNETELKRTQIFSYNGWIGIKSGLKVDGLLNNPMEKNQLGFVVDTEFVDITPEALELLKKVPRSGDDIGEVDIWKTNDGKIIIAWLGPWIKMFKPEDITGSNTYDASLITKTINFEPDHDFIEAVKKENQI